MVMKLPRIGFPLLVLLSFLIVAGCSDRNPDAPLSGQAHPQGWLAQHPAAARVDQVGCQGCHGADFKGSGRAVSCFSCHAAGPPFTLHPVWWGGDAFNEHRHFHNAPDPAQRLSWTRCAAETCHGPQLKGGSGLAPSCFSVNFTGPAGVLNTCHALGPPVPPPHVTATAYSLPGNHGPAARDSGNDNLSMGNYCINCHGRPTNLFDGGFVSDPAILGVANGNCSICHPDAKAHPTNWVRADNPNYFHGVVSGLTIAGSCARCHSTTAPGPGVAPYATAPSCFSSSFQNANGTAATCHQSPGGAGHALPFVDPILHGPVAKSDLIYCQTCHATAGGAGSNPRFNTPLGNLSQGCETCHSPGTAHPDGSDRWTFQADLAGTRRTHFAAGNVLTACKLCHNVEAGDTGGTAPPCTGCHVSAPQFALVCTACHGNPPGAADTLPGALAVNHAAVPLLSHDQCGRCHGARDDGTGKLVAVEASYLLFDRTVPELAQGGDHLDGRIEMNGPAPSTGSGYNETSWTCQNAGCHLPGPPHVLSDSTLPVEYGNYGNGTAAGCAACHGYPPDGTNSVAPTPVNHTGVSNLAGFLTAHNDCVTCHGNKDDGTGSHYNATFHQDGNLQMNSAVGYNQTNFGCDTAVCHLNDVTHRLSGSGLPIALVDFGGAACDSCHSNAASGAPVVIAGTTAHTSSLTCQGCHTGHGLGTVIIPNNATVGINYTAAGHNNGISLGGPATTGTTEAEICWNCHDDYGEIYSEWGANTDTNATAPNYNYGRLVNPTTLQLQWNWIGARWESAVLKFSYKAGTIQSTHAAAVSAGVGTTSRSGVDDLGAIRCSYCHDVHNLNRAPGDTQIGPPYLRGSWMGNPYREDGAPQAGDSWTQNNRFGAVPRGGTQAVELGGYQIDQNNSNPTTGGVPAHTTNATAAWSLANNAGLCTLCHGSNVDSLNQYGTASADWLGSNGHSNAAIGGTGINAANVFSMTIRNPSGALLYASDGSGKGNPRQAYGNAGLFNDTVPSGDNTTTRRGYGLRSQDSNGYRMAPQVTNSEPYAFRNYNWGASVDDTLDSRYHEFPCSKCHNPHASRLPRLMITNCLDTRHNTWDDDKTTPTTVTLSSENRGVPLSNATSAQNCHRLRNSAYANSTGTGWNRVTPW